MVLTLSAHPEFLFTSWIVFSSIMAGLAATLFSVMFVLLQVRWRLWVRSGLRRAVATSALGELMVPLFVSAIALMADNPWRIAAWIGGLFGIGVILALGGTTGYSGGGAGRHQVI
jgi:hypothetical protein